MKLILRKLIHRSNKIYKILKFKVTKDMYDFREQVMKPYKKHKRKPK